jgi:hypothetical protein
MHARKVWRHSESIRSESRKKSDDVIHHYGYGNMAEVQWRHTSLWQQQYGGINNNMAAGNRHTCYHGNRCYGFNYLLYI